MNLDDKSRAEKLTKISNKNNSVSFEEYKSFCYLLNNMTDFKTMLGYFHLSQTRNLGKTEIKRASDLTTSINGVNESTDNLLDILCSIFDIDDDSSLNVSKLIQLLNGQRRTKYAV